MLKKYFSDDGLEQFNVESSELKAIADYTGLNFREILELPYKEYLSYRNDSWTYNLKSSDKGREFLTTLKRLNTKKADMKAIREIKGV